MPRRPSTHPDSGSSTGDEVSEAFEPRRPPFRHGGNPDGNERLTGAIGFVVLGLAVVEVATLLLGLGTYLRVHVLVGLVLLVPIAAKLANTGWRFARYYTRNAAYRQRGAPELPMRILAPLLVLATVVLFGSGVAMGLVHGQALQVARRLHGPAAVAWMVLLGLHVLVYAPRALRIVAAEMRARTRHQVGGVRLRLIVLGTVLLLTAATGAATWSVQRDWLHLHRGYDERRDREGASRYLRPAGRGAAAIDNAQVGHSATARRTWRFRDRGTGVGSTIG